MPRPRSCSRSTRTPRACWRTRPPTSRCAKYVVPIAEAGELVASVGGSESVPGKNNLGTSSSQLVRNEQGQWVLNCTKHFASLGPGASHFIIWLAMPGTEDYDYRTVAVLVPRDVPEVELIDNWDVLGMRSTVSWAVKVTDYVLPDDAIFGEPGWWETDDTRTFTLAFAANHLGAARGAFDFTVDWVRERPQLAGSELIQFQLGELAAKLSTARAGLFHAAEAWDAGRRSEGEFRGVHALTVAKAVALEVTQRCLDICGSRSMFKTYRSSASTATPARSRCTTGWTTTPATSGRPCSRRGSRSTATAA
ncbi:hypothetical protein GS498_20745 [Rhodococcus hoagii]|nr:hypothetical protein [Prescottella equi]